MNDYTDKTAAEAARIGNNGLDFATSPSAEPRILTRNRKKLFDIDKKDIIFFVLTAVSLFLFTRIGFICAFNLGFTLTYCLLCGCCVVYSYNKACTDKPFYITVLALAVLLSVSFCFNTDYSVKFFDFVFLIYLTVLSINGLSGSVKNSDFSYALLLDLFKNSFLSAFENLSLPFGSFKASVKSGKSKNALNILTGILIALPVLCVIVPVLSSSDFAFDGLVSSAFKNLGVMIVCLVFTVIFTPLVFSYIFALRKGVVRDNGKETQTPAGMVSPSLLNSFLICICAAYILYLFSQLAYVSDALSFLLPEEYTAAEFARRGFFEMLVISVINLLILCVCSFLVKSRQDGKLPLLTKCLLIFLGCFSLFYIVSALYRMLLYISRFAYTSERILTSVFMVMLALIFIVVLISLFVRKLPYMKAITLICAAALCFVSFADINSLVVHLNYNAYTQMGIELDVEEIRYCQTGVEELMKIYDDVEFDNEQRYEAAGGITDFVYDNFELSDDEYFAVENLSVKDIQKLHSCKSIFEFNYNNNRNIRYTEKLLKEQPEKMREIFKFYYEYDFSDYKYDYSE